MRARSNAKKVTRGPSVADLCAWPRGRALAKVPSLRCGLSLDCWHWRDRRGCTRTAFLSARHRDDALVGRVARTLCHASPLTKMIPQGGSATILPPSMARVQRCLTAFAFLISACGLIYDTSRLGPDRTSNADGGGDGSDAKPPRFCETLTPKVHFCADFDDGHITDRELSFRANNAHRTKTLYHSILLNWDQAWKQGRNFGRSKIRPKLA